MLHFLQAIILGMIQGITEPLPVSSTAHTAIIQRLFDLDQSIYGLTFDMFINIGTTTAVIAFFWKDLVRVFSSMRLPIRKKLTTPERLPWIILIACIPAGLAGLILEKRIASDFRSPFVIAASLVIIGLIMILAERWSTGKGSSNPTENHLLQIGLAQALAVIPGVSRSGITISAGLLSGLDRVTAAEYSFFLSIPITLAAILKRLVEFVHQIRLHEVSVDVLTFYLVGAVASYITAYLTLRFLLAFYSRYSLKAFAWYRFALAGVILLLFWGR